MSEPLDFWYQRELDYFRENAIEFSRRFPKIADRLGMSAAGTSDPHVERLIQAFAYLNARTRHKLDDSFPELADAMLSVLYPHMLAPVPSMTVLQFELNPGQKDQTAGHVIRSGTPLESERVGSYTCQFRTCYPLKLYPLEMTAARLLPRPFSGPDSPGRSRAEAAFRLQLNTFDPKKSLGEYELNELQFYVHIANFEKAADLFELLFTKSLEIVVTGTDETRAAAVLPASCLQPVGFADEDALLPWKAQSFPGYRLLTEYFVLPQKYLFFRITGLTPAVLQKLDNQLEITVLLREGSADLEKLVSRDSIRMGCTPIVNLFHRTADSIPLSYRTAEYRIVPDARAEDSMEIYSVEDVEVEDQNGDLRPYRQFYSVSHSASTGDTGFWHATRRPGPLAGDVLSPDEGTEMYLSLVDSEFSPRRPGTGSLHARLICFNRSLPDQLRTRNASQLRFDIIGGRGPVSSIACLVPPTQTIRRHMGRRNLWPLISQLSLNHLSLTSSEEALTALQEMLTLSDVRESPQSQSLIDGIVKMTCSPTVQRVGGAFARGVEVHLVMDDERYSGDSAYLFASVLDRFFAMYTTINSFTRLTATTRDNESREAETWKWTARAGEKPLI
ncbi:MAG: type VI secretion system baseplate subunit TssF [Planctomycetaceae bacterium]